VLEIKLLLLFFPYPFQYISDWSLCHSTLYSLDVGSADRCTKNKYLGKKSKERHTETGYCEVLYGYWTERDFAISQKPYVVKMVAVETLSMLLQND
jgi:hypothetical protein